jgi:hypothetical protein
LATNSDDVSRPTTINKFPTDARRFLKGSACLTYLDFRFISFHTTLIYQSSTILRIRFCNGEFGWTITAAKGDVGCEFWKNCCEKECRIWKNINPFGDFWKKKMLKGPTYHS